MSDPWLGALGDSIGAWAGLAGIGDDKPVEGLAAQARARAEQGFGPPSPLGRSAPAAPSEVSSRLAETGTASSGFGGKQIADASSAVSDPWLGLAGDVLAPWIDAGKGLWRWGNRNNENQESGGERGAGGSYLGGYGNNPEAQRGASKIQEAMLRSVIRSDDRYVNRFKQGQTNSANKAASAQGAADQFAAQHADRQRQAMAQHLLSQGRSPFDDERNARNARSWG